MVGKEEKDSVSQDGYRNHEGRDVALDASTHRLGALGSFLARLAFSALRGLVSLAATALGIVLVVSGFKTVGVE